MASRRRRARGIAPGAGPALRVARIAQVNATSGRVQHRSTSGVGAVRMGAAPFAAPQTGTMPGNELDMLKAQADQLEQTLAQIRERIDSLEGKGE